MPEHTYIYYRNPFAVADTVQSQPLDTLCSDSVVPSFITSGHMGSVVPLPRVTYDVVEGWNLLILALVLLLVVLNKQLFPRQFRQVLNVPGGTANTNQLLREWNPVNSFLGTSFLMAYIAVMALFVQKAFVVLSRDVAQYNSFRMYGMFFGMVFCWVALRFVVLYYVNWLFGSRDTVSRQVSVQLSVSTYGLFFIFLLALLMLYTPSPIFVWVGLGIVGAAALLRFVLQIIETRVAAKVSVFYIFLYFCALEIVPVATLLAAGLRYYGQGSVF